MSNKQLEMLGQLSKNVKWEIEAERSEFFHKIDAVIIKWKGQLPNLLLFFRKEVINWLLMESVTGADEDATETPGERFIDFVACSGYKDEPDTDKDGKPLLNRTTPIHHAYRKNLCGTAVFNLFHIYNKSNVNYMDEDGLTHLHVACRYGISGLVEKFLAFGREDPNGSQRLIGGVAKRFPDSPLYLALVHRHESTVIPLLLQKGVDLRGVSADGSTAVQIICQDNYDDVFLQTFFDFCGKKRLRLIINDVDSKGYLPLDHALLTRNKTLMELLLRYGASSNERNKDGDAALHTICKYFVDDDEYLRFLKAFFAINDEFGKTVWVDAENTQDETPLYLALKNNNKSAVELLLRRGADPNWKDKNGLSLLHIFMDHCDDAELLKLFFSKEVNRSVQIDARDRNSRTPLQWAVATLLPDMIDVLLDQGADLSRFVFPSKSFIVERIGPINEMEERKRIEFKLSIASRIVAVVERLEKRGYQFYRSKSLDIMSLFAEYELFEKSTDLERNWYDDKNFVMTSKSIMVNSSLSLHDLIRLRPEGAAKQLKHENYVELARSNKLSDLPEGHREVCARHLCEKLSRGFFWPWALDAFYELQCYQLPVSRCVMIIANLKNEDLYNICLASILALGERSSYRLITKNNKQNQKL